MRDLRLKISWILALVWAIGLAGCAGQPASHSVAKANELKKAQKVEELVKACEKIMPYLEGGTRIYALEPANDIWELTREALWRGDQDVLATIILDVKEGRRPSCHWSVLMERAFAHAWRKRNVPIQMGASELTIKALKILAEEGANRNARVAAASAIYKVDPELARTVLLREYGDVWIPRRDIAFMRSYNFLEIPLAAGSCLGALGVDVPNEITSWEEAYDVLTRPARRQARKKLTYLRVEQAVKAYNKKLRELMLAKKMEELAKIHQQDLLRECLDAVPVDYKEPVEPEREGSLFAEDGGDEEDVEDDDEDGGE